jgi:hypothetical protein
MKSIEKEFPIGYNINFKIDMTKEQIEEFKKRRFDESLIKSLSENTIGEGKIVGHENEYLMVESGFGFIDKIHYTKCFLTKEDKKIIQRENNINEIIKKEE